MHGGRLGSPIGVPAALIGERGETSLVAGAGPDGVPRCQIRRSPSAATDRVCPPRSQYRSIYRKIKNPFPVVSTLCRGTPSLWSTVHGGRLGSPIGVPAALIGERGETSLVAGAGPDGVPRCQIRRSPSAATDRVCPPRSQYRSVTCGRQSTDPVHPVTLLIQQWVDAEVFSKRGRPA